MALVWANSRTVLEKVDDDLFDKIPGRLHDRRTPLGELNWIFTAITDTIAWNVFPSEIFQRLFRQDLLVASLMRNYLLAERIMRSYNCIPVCYPALPPSYLHPLWRSWDLIVDICLSSLDSIIHTPKENFLNDFFTEQLTAFEIWLEFGENKKLQLPEQLPFVLQVLLCKQHRLRALELLGKFFDLGPWAVNYALSVGIFPYILKLLQSPSVELRQVLVFIWSKIVSLDKSCQVDLLKESGHFYFTTIFTTHSIAISQRIMSGFVLTVIMDGNKSGQNACLQTAIIQQVLHQLADSNPLLRKWSLLYLAKLWEENQEARWLGIQNSAHEKICTLLTDPVPDVRTAAIYALGTFIGSAGDNEQFQLVEMNIGLTLLFVTSDMNPLPRKELILSLSRLIFSYPQRFIDTIIELSKDEIKFVAERARMTSSSNSVQSGKRLTSSTRSTRDSFGTPSTRISFSLFHSDVFFIQY